MILRLLLAVAIPLCCCIDAFSPLMGSSFRSKVSFFHPFGAPRRMIYSFSSGLQRGTQELEILQSNGHQRRTNSLFCTANNVDNIRNIEVFNNDMTQTVIDTDTADDVNIKQSNSIGKPVSPWEEKYADDPLRSDSPTMDLVQPVDPYSNWYLCVGKCPSSTPAQQKRQEAWSYYLQWARRSILLQGLRNRTGLERGQVFDDTELGEKVVPDLRNGDTVDPVDDETSCTNTNMADLPQAKVEWAYTMLTQDCMRPYAQVMAIRANNSEDVYKYIESEPLVNHGGVAPWKVLQMNIRTGSGDVNNRNNLLGVYDSDNDGNNDCLSQPVEDVNGDSFSLAADLHAPFIFLCFSSSNDSQTNITVSGKIRSARCTELLAQSIQYHTEASRQCFAPVTQRESDNNFRGEAATMRPLPRSVITDQELYTPGYDVNVSRVHVYSTLLTVQPSAETSKCSKPLEHIYRDANNNMNSCGTNSNYRTQLHPGNPPSAVGQLVIFSARSRADALRYLARDPLARVALGISCDSNDIGTARNENSSLFDVALLSPANLLDISGLHHVLPQTFAQFTQLEQFGFMDPEDLLDQPELEEPGNCTLAVLASLPNHLKENKRTLELLRNHSISFRYANKLGRHKLYGSANELMQD